MFKSSGVVLTFLCFYDMKGLGIISRGNHPPYFVEVLTMGSLSITFYWLRYRKNFNC